MFYITGNIRETDFSTGKHISGRELIKFFPDLIEMIPEGKPVAFKYHPSKVRNVGKSTIKPPPMRPKTICRLSGDNVDLTLQYYKSYTPATPTRPMRFGETNITIFGSDTYTVSGQDFDLALFLLLHPFCADSPFAQKGRSPVFMVMHSIKEQRAKETAAKGLSSALNEAVLLYNSNPKYFLAVALGLKVQGRYLLSINEKMPLPAVTNALTKDYTLIEQFKNSNTIAAGIFRMAVNERVVQKHAATGSNQWKYADGSLLLDIPPGEDAIEAGIRHIMRHEDVATRITGELGLNPKPAKQAAIQEVRVTPVHQPTPVNVPLIIDTLEGEEEEEEEPGNDQGSDQAQAAPPRRRKSKRKS